MSWKYVLNVDSHLASNPIEASVITANAGYQFFLFEGVVYFIDAIGCKTFKTNISEKDLF